MENGDMREKTEKETKKECLHRKEENHNKAMAQKYRGKGECV